MENNKNVLEVKRKYNKLAIISFVSSLVSFLILLIITLDVSNLFFRELPFAQFLSFRELPFVRFLSFLTGYLGVFFFNLVPICFIIGGIGGMITIREIKYSREKGKGLAISAIFLAILSIFMFLHGLYAIVTVFRD
ncbi:MAG: hypothetical protein WC603_02475 [Candidatus Paceibacterota bacterium]|jgi:hypothetical protein